MDFPLVPAVTLTTIPSRERAERVPQNNPETSPTPWAAPTQTLFIKNYKPVGDTVYIDVEFEEIFDQTNQSKRLLKWPQFRLRQAMNLYQKVAEGEQPKEHIIDLYA